MTEEQVFLAALDLPEPADRNAYLDKACGNDPEFRSQVESLLASHFKTGEFLDEPIGAQLAGTPIPNDTISVRFKSEGQAMGKEVKTDDEPDDLHFLQPSSRPDSLGRIGHYEVLQILGKGGFGIVFRAFDEVLQRVVALKVLAPSIAATSPARKRFMREAQASAKVRHENVVQVHAVEEKPVPYLVMEYIPGETLQQRLDRIGPLEVPEILRLGREIAEGLAAAHATGLIHRDIKPGNVIVESGPHERAKITDFGLARAADDASMTQSGVLAGTPMYMAPEQAKGETLDHRADLFSLGSVLYVMATGRPPFRAATTFAVLKRVAEEEPRSIRDVIPEMPEWLCGIITRLHAKKPEDRFQTALEVAELLADCEAKLKAQQEVKNVLPASAAKPTMPSVAPAPTISPAPNGRKIWAAMAAVVFLPVLVLAVTEFAGVTHLFRGEQPTPDPIKPVSGPTPPLADGWVRLFNGKDLTGWKDHPNQPGHWEVKDGILIGSKRPSILFSARGDYVNFHLRAEAKINLGGDSSICFRSGYGLRRGKLRWQFGPAGGYEAELHKDVTHAWQTGSVSEVTGNAAPTLLSAAADDSLTQADEWFTMEIIAEQNRFITKVNGKETANCSDPLNKYPTGHIALQMWNANTAVQFRKIEIKELPPNTLPPTFKNSIGMEFVIVPKGKSWLGGGKDKLGDHEVEIPADFYLGKHEVTQEEWEKVMGENPSHFSRTGEGKDAVKDVPDADLKRFPVEMVSWNQCQTFVARLNKLENQTGWVYRLPTEVEWEYACRGGPMADKLNSFFDYYFAKPTNTLLPGEANFGADKLNRTCKVGSYKPNVLGLHDMHGNLWEWCEDLFDPNNPETAFNRADRGGSGGNDTQLLKATTREGCLPSAVDNWHGLRLARVPSGAPSSEAKTPSDPKPTVHDTWLKAAQLLPLDQHAAALPAKLKAKLPEFDDAFLRAIPSMSADRQVIMAEGWLKERKLAIAGFDDAWLKAIPSMATDAQVILVTGWLKERNPAFDGEMTHKTEGGVITSLEMPSPHVHDLTPLRVLTGLRSLTCLNPVGYDSRAESDAAVLRSLKKLESINGKSLAQFWKEIEARPAELKVWLELVSTLNANQKVAAVSAKFKERNPGFAGVVRQKVEDGVVTELTFKNVRDLSPLRALEGLTVLNSTAGPLSDLSPLKGLPLTALDLGGTQVRDLSPLTGMQLTSLNLHSTRVQDLERLKGLPLTSLGLQFTKVQNLEPLKDMPLTRLHLNGCDQVRDLAPLKGMPLTRLELYGCRQVRNLEPLKDMPLTYLHLGSCPEVRDLEVLKGMPLKRLLINNTGVTDLKPLQAMPLEYIRLTPKNITQGLNVLRDMKSLKTIGVTENQDLPAAEFWARYDKGEFKN